MSIRGSAWFLLLFFRARGSSPAGWERWRRCWLWVASRKAGPGFKLMERTGLGQLVHQRAWERALAGHSEMEPWPWEDPSLMANTKVPQLGLSAAVLERLKRSALGRRAQPAPSRSSCLSPRRALAMSRSAIA